MTDIQKYVHIKTYIDDLPNISNFFNGWKK